ncbi:hypothetical protein AAHC03_013320 [Spirometra sp. Aus1]|nr:unnamed protein product [Spirometra erinaceieuropaei]
MLKAVTTEDPQLNELQFPRLKLHFHVHLKGLQVSAAFFNVLLLCVGLVCITISISVTLLANYVVRAFPFNLATASILLLLLGVFTSVVSLFTPAELRKRRDRAVGKYTVAVVVILFFLCGIIVGLFQGAQRMQMLAEVRIHRIYDEKNHSVYARTSVFLTENQLHCCGRDRSDFYPTDNLPISCCADLTTKCTADKAFKLGCVDSMKKLIHGRLIGFTTILLICLFPLLGAIINGFVLYLYLRKVKAAADAEFSS